jgi:cytochrome b561
MVPAPPRRFTVFSRLLHWVMAVMILAMLGIGTAMFASPANYHALVALHRPIGIATLLLATVRLANRLFNPPPPLPASVSRVERLVAIASEYTMYGLMFALPLVGWGMLSAAHYPAVLWGSLHLPEILPHSAPLFAILRQAHTVLAVIFLLLILAHLAAVLFHTLIVGDGIWRRMAPWPVRDTAAGQ